MTNVEILTTTINVSSEKVSKRKVSAVMERIYLDHAATTPVDRAVIEAMNPYFYERFGNASSPHTVGQKAKKAIEDARDHLAGFIGAQAEEIVFTSGGTESNNHAILSTALARRSQGNHIIVSNIEHHSVSEPIAFLEKEGFQITRIGVDQDGLVNPVDVAQAINDKTILISVMHANNEIGAIQPIAEIGKIAREKGILFHSDCVQTVGHIPVNVEGLQVDFLSLSAHKFYGPPGVGALYIRKGTNIPSFLRGGDQERGRRASTHNLPGIVGLGKAVELCQSKMTEEMNAQIVLRDKVIAEIFKRVDGVRLNGHPRKRLPNNMNFSFDDIDGESLLMSLDIAGIAASMGSACTSGSMEASYVLKAVGLSEELAFGSLRVTIGRWTTSQHINCFIEQLPSIINRLRAAPSK